MHNFQKVSKTLHSKLNEKPWVLSQITGSYTEKAVTRKVNAQTFKLAFFEVQTSEI